ncbi:adenosylcobinamide-phosphate synthase CbiB [Chitinibacteraceae bacterium HSL-7]
MLATHSPTMLLLALSIALALEALVGEPRRFHPLVGFGHCAQWLEHRLNRAALPRAFTGAVALVLLLALPVLLFCLLFLLTAQLLPGWFALLATALLHGVALWFALGANSLLAHVARIAAPLKARNLPAARMALSMIVSRDCSQLDETAIAKGAIESNLENGSDAIFATLFWFALFGGAGAVLHRLANTLDAMWGYRTERFNLFGRSAARCDDALNWLPARLTALSYALLGQTRPALHIWRTQAPAWDSPNAGPVMAAGAGALGITLGGNAVYHGQLEVRTELGSGPAPAGTDIDRSLVLVKKTLALWLTLLYGVLIWRAFA